VCSDVNEGACLNKIDSQTVTLDWSIGNDTVRSRHKVYTIGGSLGFRNDYHTLIEIGCEAAKGLDSSTQQDEVFNRICNKFATLDIKRIDSDDPITYWGNNASLTNSIDDMLYWLTGRCGPWSKFFVKTCELQGISVGEVIITPSFPAVALVQTAPKYQGDIILNTNDSTFQDHVINKYNNKYFDVTSGAGPYDSIEDYLVDNLYVLIKTGSYIDEHGVTHITMTPQLLTYGNIDTYISHQENN
ncbi:MAG: hypothetical protein IJT95_02635, partial [Abditibacteriota bacterium]|nr:hypothetical protein [Abditibacteriota bacterium]